MNAVPPRLAGCGTSGEGTGHLADCSLFQGLAVGITGVLPETAGGIPHPSFPIQHTQSAMIGSPLLSWHGL